MSSAPSTAAEEGGGALRHPPPPLGEDVSWLLEILRSVQLEQFFVRIRDHLQVTRLEHFEFVTPEDLEKVGMARPAARRLLDLIKRKRRKMLVGKLLPAPLQSKFGTLKKSKNLPSASSIDAGATASATSVLTCLIHDKDVTLQGKSISKNCHVHRKA